jgi:hypothetical protein
VPGWITKGIAKSVDLIDVRGHAAALKSASPYERGNAELEELRTMVKDAFDCYFDETQAAYRTLFPLQTTPISDLESNLREE